MAVLDKDGFPAWPPSMVLLPKSREIDEPVYFADAETGAPDIIRRVDACIADPSGYWFLISLKPL